MRGTHPERALEQAVQRDGALKRGDRVVIACSGGADSVGLAAVVHALAKSMDLQLVLAHVNHGVRASAWQDEAVVLRVSAALGIPCTIRALEPAASSAEASLRDARYAALCEVARKNGANAIATAHTAEDQTETVLLALFRGAGLQGVSGMPARREIVAGIDLVRPLLRQTRSEVTLYAQHAGLPFAIDPTNADLTFRRNAVREALAALRPLFPGLDEAVSRAARLAADEAAGTQQAHHRRSIRQTLSQEGALADVGFEHVEAVVRAMQSGGSGRFSVGSGAWVLVENGTVSVHREDK